jgi:hypothetical protein
MTRVWFAALVAAMSVFILIGSPPAQAHTVVTLGGGFSFPQSVAVDGSRDVF